MNEKYKYDVKKIKETRSSPKYLLGDSIKETEELLAEFTFYINNLARAYSESTNIDRGDFFGEAIIALGKAKADFDPKRGGEFAPFAKFIIVDAMNECVRINKAVVITPVYIDKAHKIIVRIKNVISNYTDSFDDVVFNNAFDKAKIPKSIKAAVLYDKNLLNRAAKRSKLTLVELIERAEFLPLVLQKDVTKEADGSDKPPLAKLIVGEILELLDDEETAVADLIMDDKNRSDICKLLSCSDDWVVNRIKAIRRKAKQALLRGNGN